MLEDTYERHVLGDLYADERLGLYVIRGENMVLLGELVSISLPPMPTRHPRRRLLLLVGAADILCWRRT